jgi:putative glutamine amidotransferase
MPRPLIGITCDYNDKRTAYNSPYGYARSIERAGGLPVILPYRADVSLVPMYVECLAGILFSGGDDMDPSAYGEEWHPDTVKIDPLREQFERALIAEVERRRMPVLGVCLGSQLMNIHRGGSMHQFLPDVSRDGSLEHRNLDRAWVLTHPVKLDPESVVARVIGKNEITVNTSHKQAIRSPGRGLRVIATSPDGVIEGIEDPTMPLFVGVQWHPERMTDDDDHLKLFQLLVEKARG